LDDQYLLADSIYEEGAAFSRAPMDLPVQLGIATPIEDPSGQALSSFHSALRRAETGAGQARIVFYGASHVASDYFTGYLRQKLQARFGEAGTGFVLPAKPWPWYRNAGIAFDPSRGWNALWVKEKARKKDRYGLAGVALEATERRSAFAAIRTRPNGPLSGSANRFEIYYLKQPNGGKIRLSVDQVVTRMISTASKSVETGYESIETSNGPHRFEVRTFADGVVRLFGVAVENDKPGVLLDTLGIPGARATYHLFWDDAIYREHLRKRRPDLVVIAYGTNESGDKDFPIENYEEELRKVVARIREVVPEASCLLVSPSDRPERVATGGFEPRPRTAQIIDVQRRVATDFSCGFFDLVACTGGAMSMVAWAAATPAYGASDHVHFTAIGYQRIGELLLQALLANYPEDAAPSE
jgi:lysophospholipase L1-like esterase